MNNDLISRSELLKKAIRVSEFDEGGWERVLRAVPVEEIEAARAGGGSMSEWISVEERLPEPSTYVLVLTAPGSLSLGQNQVVADYIHPRDEKHGIFVNFYAGYKDENVLEVTHWMPLPEPPAMRKPVFVNDITHLGVWYWIEIEGYEKMIRKQSGAFAFAEAHIMGWDVQTMGECWKKQQEVNFAPRWRLWEGEEPPTALERAVSAGVWRDDERAWQPLWESMRVEERYAEWCETGRTKWEE